MDVKKIALAAVLVFLILVIPVFAANYTLKVYTYDKNSGSALPTDITVLDSAGQPVPGCSGTAVTTLQCANLPKAQYTIQAYNSNYNPLRDTFTLRSDQTRHLFLVPDTTAPSTSFQVSGTRGNPIDGVDWYTDAVTVDLTCSDSGSGCARLVAELDGVITADGAPPISLTLNVLQNGPHTLRYYSEDAADNREAVKTYIFGIDTTPPVIAGAGSGWTNVPQQFSPTCSDPETGCDSFFGYSSPTAIAQCSANSVDYNVPLPAPVSTHEFWCAGAENEVGLFSFTPQPFEFKVDLIPPVVDSRIVPDGAVYSPSQIYWFNATVEENEDIQTVEFDFDGQRFLPVKDNGEYGISFAGLGAGTHSVRWRAVDLAGNDHVFVRNLVIEKAPTTITLTIDGSAERQMIDTGTTFAARAELSIPGSVSLTSDYTGFSEISGPSPLQTDTFFETTGTFTVTASFSGDDNYLPSTASIIIDSVERPDSEPPVITVTTPLNESTVQTAKVPLEFTVSDSNPVTITLNINGQSSVITGNTLLELSQNTVNIVTLTVQDIFGNAAEYVLQFTIPVLSSVVNSVIDGTVFADELLNVLEGESTFVRSEIINSTVITSSLTDSRLVRSTIESTILTDSDVTDASLKNSVLVRSTFIGKEAEDVEAEDSFLDPGNFTGSKFKNCTIVNSNVTYSNVTDCSITDSNVGLSVVNATSLTNSTVSNSRVTGFAGTEVNITDDILVSGTVTYKGKEFTGPTNLSDIYSYVPPQPPQPPDLPQGPTPGGGGGGGGGGFTPVYSISASAEESSFDMKEGEIKSLAVELENKGNVRLTEITLTLTEIPAGWYSFESLPASLDAGQKANITIIFAPTGESAEKSGKLLVNSSQGALTEIPVSVKFTGSAPPQTTTTTTTVPGTTTTTLSVTTTTGPNPLTGLFTAVGSNPAAVAVVGIVLVVIGSIGWSMRKDSTKKKRAVETEEKEAEPANNN